MDRRIVCRIIALLLFSTASLCSAGTTAEEIRFRAAPDQVLVLYNADWTEDSAGSVAGQDSREIAEYYQQRHTDPVTGKKPFLLPLTCVHGDKHLNDWFIKEQSNDNKNAITFIGKGKAPEDFNWVLDSRNVEITVPEKNTDWDSLVISIRSELSAESKTIYQHQLPTGGLVVTVSGPPQRSGYKRNYPPMKVGEGRCFRFDITQLFKGAATVSLTVDDKEGKQVTDLAVKYFDRDDFLFSPTGQDGISDEKHLEEDVLKPVRAFLEDPANAISEGQLLKQHILYLLVVRGLPYAANGALGIEHGATDSKGDHGSLASLEQRLQTLYYPWGSRIKPPVISMYLTNGPQAAAGVGSYIITTAMRYPLTGTRWNPYLHPDAYASKNSSLSFYPVAPLAERRKHLPATLHAFAAIRIDGKTPEDAKRLVDNALYASRYLRPEMDCNVRQRLQGEGLTMIKDLPDRLQSAVEENLWDDRELAKLGFSTTDSNKKPLPFMVMPVGAAAGRCSDQPPDWRNTGFYPGGMHFRVVSSNGLNFDKAEVWQMIERGVSATAAGAPAYSGGPHITSATFWDNRIVMRYLLRGKDLGEALFLSNFYTNWSTSYVGDPLLHPDLSETVIDQKAPIVAGQQLSVDLQRTDEAFTATFAAALDDSVEEPEMAVMRVSCVDQEGAAVEGYSELFSRRPEAALAGLLPEQEYNCSVDVADPYDNRTSLPAVQLLTPKITVGDKIVKGVVDFFKGIKVVPK